MYIYNNNKCMCTTVCENLKEGGRRIYIYREREREGGREGEGERVLFCVMFCHSYRNI